jgi:hypothetical protein
VAAGLASPVVFCFFRKQKNHSANAARAIAAAAPTATPAIHALLLAPEAWLGDDGATAVGVVPDGTLEAGEAAVAGVLSDDVSVFDVEDALLDVADVLVSVTTESAARVSIQLRGTMRTVIHVVDTT